jgi:hypothetical protein
MAQPITIDGTPFASLKEALLVLAHNPTCRVRLRIARPDGTGHDTIPVHCECLAKTLRALPSTWEAELLEHEGRMVIWLWWDGERHGVHHRGQLYLRALGTIELGPKAAEALYKCASRKEPYWRVSTLPKELWSAVAEIFGSKKYAHQNGQQAAAMIEAYGWRNYSDVELARAVQQGEA